VQEAESRVQELSGALPEIWVTSARAGEPPLAWDAARTRLRGEGPPILLLFGTGHGLAAELMERADVTLPPVRPNGYNHLSVRAAVAIILDRLQGDG